MSLCCQCSVSMCPVLLFFFFSWRSQKWQCNPSQRSLRFYFLFFYFVLVLILHSGDTPVDELSDRKVDEDERHGKEDDQERKVANKW